MESITNEAVDLENVPMEEVFETLKCSQEGLSTEAAEQRLSIFGNNKLEEKRESKILKFLGFMWNPLSWVMEAAAIMAIVLANGGGKPPEWQDFTGIATLLLINSTVCFIQENNAGAASAALMARLAPKAKRLRPVVSTLRNYSSVAKQGKLASVEELEPFVNHASQMAALDYIVSIESDVFIPSYS